MAKVEIVEEFGKILRTSQRKKNANVTNMLFQLKSLHMNLKSLYIQRL